MTPVEIEVMVHYYCREYDFRSDSMAVKDALQKLVRLELLCFNPFNPYTITAGGRMYVEALKAVPTPVKQWVMPTQPE